MFLGVMIQPPPISMQDLAKACCLIDLLSMRGLGRLHHLVMQDLDPGELTRASPW